MTSARPPLLPASVDLRRMPRMPLDVQRLRDSDISRAKDAEGFRCAVLAWCVAWHQVPASSLPDDDDALADLLGVGRTARAVKEWQGLRPTALRGFVKCSDGRLYHPVIADIAIDTWRAMLEQRHRSDQARKKKAAQRTKTAYVPQDFSLWITCEYPDAVPYLSRWTGRNVPEDKPEESQGQTPSVPRETGSKGKERILPSTTMGDCSSTGAGTDQLPPSGENPESNPSPASGTWWKSERGWLDEGARLGVKPMGTEDWPSFRARVKNARAEERKAQRHAA